MNANNVKRIQDELNRSGVTSIIKKYFEINNYPREDVDEALKEYTFTQKTIVTHPHPIISDPVLPKSKETIQEWVKRIFTYLFKNNILTEQEIIRLHDLNYSKRKFEILFPLLVDTLEETQIQGHNRYWRNKIGKYYICSQWQLHKDADYEFLIRQWLVNVFPDYQEYSLNRIYYKY